MAAARDPKEASRKEVKLPQITAELDFGI